MPVSFFAILRVYMKKIEYLLECNALIDSCLCRNSNFLINIPPPP